MVDIGIFTYISIVDFDGTKLEGKYIYTYNRSHSDPSWDSFQTFRLDCNS